MAGEAPVTSILCVVAALAVIAVILAPNVREGVVIRTGLSLVVVGLFAVAAQVDAGRDVTRSLSLLSAGVSVAALGLLLRVRGHARI